MSTACAHPIIYNTLCAVCGKVVPNARSCNTSQLSIKGGLLRLNEEETVKIQSSKSAMLQKLQQNQKLALVLDLDHTLLHAVQIDGPTPSQTVQANGEIHHLPIEDIVGGTVKHLVMKKRPHLDYFLEKAQELFQMTIYTAGTKRYAEAVVRVIDPKRVYIGDRIVSRLDGQAVKAESIDKSLDRIFLKDSSMAVIIDDRQDVWKGDQNQQLLLVRPYMYFYPNSAMTKAVGAHDGISEVNNAPGMSGTSGTTSNGAALSPVISLYGNPGAVKKTAPHESPEFTEEDNQLLRCLEILKDIHQRYYEMANQSKANSQIQANQPVPTKMSVPSILNEIRKSVLAGCTITFSGVIPTNDPHPEDHFLWKLADSLGAQISMELLPRTTHLLSFTTGTKKVTTCLTERSKDVWVLHPDWLIYCKWTLARAEEKTFMLTSLEKDQKFPEPKLDFNPLRKQDSLEIAPISSNQKKRKAADSVNITSSEDDITTQLNTERNKNLSSASIEG